MMKSFRKKLGYWAALTATVLSVVGSGSVALFGTTAHAEGNAIADKTTQRSINILKYEIDKASDATDRGDGTLPDVLPDKPLEGIEFQIERVNAKSGVSLTDPMTDSGKYDIDTAFDKAAVGEGKKVVVTTGTDGKAKYVLPEKDGDKGAWDGVYLITELDNAAVASKANPFFIHVPLTDPKNKDNLLYDVYALPKNILKKGFDPVKTIEGKENHSIKAGQTFNWEATATVPNGLYTKAETDLLLTKYNENEEEIGTLKLDAGEWYPGQEFRITDTLDGNLQLEGVKVEVGDGTNWESLTGDTHYKATINDKNYVPESTDGQTEAIETKEKKVIVQLTEAGMRKAATGSDIERPYPSEPAPVKYDKIRVVYTTKAGKIDFNGVISNKFDVFFLTPGAKPETGENPKKPNYNTGGFKILKTIEGTDATPLAGAVFHIAASEQDAKDNIFVAEDGKSYGEPKGTLKKADDAAVAAGTKLLTSTSDVDGNASFNGLALGDGENPSKDYYLVETTAPDGYELLKAPVQVTVTTETHTLAATATAITNKKKTVLPFTGGNGTMLLIALAMAAIAIGTVAIVIDKRKRHA